jgi:hypothetical protein
MNEGMLGWPASPPGVAQLGVPNVFRAAQTINLNAAPPPPPPGLVALHVVGIDAANNRITADGFSGAPIVAYRRSAGTNAVKSAVGTADILGQFQFFGYGATGYCASARASFGCNPAETWTDTAQGTQIQFNTTVVGDTSTTEKFRISDSGAIQMGGANTVISAARHHTLRSYTVATLPSAATAAEMIYVSNEVGGAVPCFSDGTNWRRVQDRAIAA